MVGDEWESPRRTVTETDVVLFAGLSGDFNPLHVDHTSAERSPFGRPVAHGLLGLAIATGLMSQAPRVDTLAFLAILEWKFHRPIVFGDTIHALSTIESLEPEPNGRRGDRHLAPPNLESRWPSRSGRSHPNTRPRHARANPQDDAISAIHASCGLAYTRIGLGDLYPNIVVRALRSQLSNLPLNL